jgi:methylenetetrahydrofolate dehydrogenase (NADP+)/methenyltetrahydrofolate cyclohydrolase
VGKPAALLFLERDCTVTLAHSRTRDLAAVCAAADILVPAVGRPNMVKADWVKPGATVIDVGINRVEGPDGKAHLTGDADFEAVRERAGFITPVPGGVGPMTIAMLLANTVTAAARRAGLAVPEALDGVTS